MLNPLTLRAAKRGLTILEIFNLQTHFLENIWRRNVYHKPNKNSPSNISWIFALFKRYFQKYQNSRRHFLEKLWVWMGSKLIRTHIFSKVNTNFKYFLILVQRTWMHRTERTLFFEIVICSQNTCALPRAEGDLDMTLGWPWPYLCLRQRWYLGSSATWGCRFSGDPCWRSWKTGYIRRVPCWQPCCSRCYKKYNEK